MNRTFSGTRFLKLFQIISASSILIAVLALLASKYSLPVAFSSYERKQQYCYDKYWNVSMPTYASCFRREADYWSFWIQVEEKSPRILVAVLGINLLGFGLYRFLFPRSHRSLHAEA